MTSKLNFYASLFALCILIFLLDSKCTIVIITLITKLCDDEYVISHDFVILEVISLQL